MREANGAELVHDSALSAEELTLLRLRAKRYARAALNEASDAIEIVVFRRGSMRYALRLAMLREVRPLRATCCIPGASACVFGIVHFRGEILSLHDIAAFMSEGADPADAAWVIVVESDGERMGLLADEVLDIELCAAMDILPLPVSFGNRGDICDGLLPHGALLLSAPRMFRCDELFFAF